MTTKQKQNDEDRTLTGWREISDFLGEPTSVVQRWRKQGMPVHQKGRFVTARRAELNDWLASESGEPLHIATEDTELASELKRGLAFVRKKKVSH